MDERRFEYRPNLVLLFVVTLLMGWFGTWYLIVAQVNRNRSFIRSIIEFTPAESTIIYYILSVICFGFAILGVWGISKSFEQGPSFLIFHSDHVEIPPAFFRPRRRIPFQKVLGLEERSLLGVKTLGLRLEGERFTLFGHRFRSKAECQEAFEALRESIQNSTRNPTSTT